jgi:restriction system protein
MTPNRSYYRIMAGAKSCYAQECFEMGFIGGYWGIQQDLKADLSDNWRDFNTRFIPVFLQANPDKTKIAAGLACGMLHTICKGMKIGDIVLCPNGSGQYYVGEVVSDYFYVEGNLLPHRRKIKWFERGINRDEMSPSLKNSAGLHWHCQQYHQIRRRIGTLAVWCATCCTQSQ